MGLFSVFATNKEKDEFDLVGQTTKTDLVGISATTKKVTGQSPTHIKMGDMPSATTQDFHVDFIPKALCEEILKNSKLNQ